MEDKKYQLIKNDKIKVDKHILYRIQSLKDFSNVSKGDLGGYIEKESNLSHEGLCWVYADLDAGQYTKHGMVYGDAVIRDDARVYGRASVFEQAIVEKDAQIFYNINIHGNAHITRSPLYKNGAPGETIDIMA